MQEQRYYQGTYSVEISRKELREILKNSNDWNKSLQEIAFSDDNSATSDDFADCVKGWNQLNSHAEIEQFISNTGSIYYRVEVTTNETCMKDEDDNYDNFNIESVADFSPETLYLLRQAIE